MDLTRESAELRREISTRRRRTRFPAELAARIRAHVVAQRSRGVTMRSVAEDLGIALDTLYRWQRWQVGEPALRRVEVVAESRAFTVSGPWGVRVEGLALDDVAALLRKLA